MDQPTAALREPHRFNRTLPSSYRAKLEEEGVQKLFALRRLASALEDSDGGGAAEAGMELAELVAGNAAEDLTTEGYERGAERDLSAFEKGLAVCLDLKYSLGEGEFDRYVRLLLRGILSANVDLGLRAKLSRTTIRLLRKRECKLSFPFPWRKIHDIILAVHNHCANGGPFIGKDVRDSHCRNVVVLLRKSRNYCTPALPPATVAPAVALEDDPAWQIWQEFGETIDTSAAATTFEPLLFLAHLLPTRGRVWNGWVPRAAEMWKLIETSSDWDCSWMGLFARLARHQPNMIDWTPFLSTVYERINPSFRLPLGAAAPQSPVEKRCPAHCLFLLNDKMTVSSAVFCVYSLTPRCPESFKYLKRLFALVKNFFHPSNNGRWSSHLASFMGHLTACLAARVSTERAATRAGVLTAVYSDNQTKPVPPLEDRLSDDSIRELMDELMPIVHLGLHSKVGYVTVQSSASARDLATILPAVVVQPMLESAFEGLVSASTPHRTSAALKTLATLTPVFLDEDLFPNGVEFLPQALELTLPGIDPNDPEKTEATLRFIAGASARLSSSQTSMDFLDDYTHQLLERIFSFLEALEEPPKKNRGGSSAGYLTLSPFIFLIAIENLFASLPTPVILSATERIAREVSKSSVVNATKFYAILVRVSAGAAATDSEGSTSSALIFLPLLINQILEEEDGTLCLSSLSEKEMVWRIRMLAQACRTCNDLYPYLDKLFRIAILAMKKSERPVYKAGGRLLRGILEGLTAIRIKFSNLPLDSNSVSDFEWWEPTQKDFDKGVEILNNALFFAEGLALGKEIDITEEITGPREVTEVKMERDKLFRALRLLHAIQRAGRWIMAGSTADCFEDMEKKYPVGSDMSGMTKLEAQMILKKPSFAGVGGEYDSPLKNSGISDGMWRRTYTLILKILKTVVEKKPDDGSLIYRCLEPIELANEPFRRSNKGRVTVHAARGYKAAYKPVVAAKRDFNAPGGMGRSMPAFIKKLRLEALHETRVSMCARAGFASDDVFSEILTTLADLSINDFPLVRAESRGAFTRALRVCKLTQRRSGTMRVINALENFCDGAATKSADGDAMQIEKKDGDEKINYEGIIGAADVLRSSSVLPYIVRDWKLFTEMGLALMTGMIAADRQDAASMMSLLFSKFASYYRPIAMDKLALPESSFEIPAAIPEVSTRMLEFTEYNEILFKKMQVKSEDSALNWRIESLVSVMLYIGLMPECPPPTKVIEFFVLGLASELISIRQVSMKAVCQVLVLAPTWPEKEMLAILDIMEKTFTGDGFLRKFVHMMALDQADDGSDGYNDVYSLGCLSLLPMAKNVDGDACWTLVSGYPWPSSWVPRSRDLLAITRVRLFESIYHQFGPKLLPLTKEVVEPLANDKEEVKGVTKENVRIIAAELISGSIRGLRSTDCAEADFAQMASWAQDLLNVFTGPEGIVNGGTMLRLICSSEDSSAGSKVGDILRSRFCSAVNIDTSLPAHLQARQLRYLHATVADLNPKDAKVGPILAEVLPSLNTQASFSHALKHVREEIARSLSLFSQFSNEGALEVYFENVRTVSSRLATFDREQEGEDETGEETKKARSREGETLSRWISIVHWNGDTSVFSRYMSTVLPAMFANLDDSDPERISHARLALSLAAQAKLPVAIVDDVVAVCEKTAASPRWRVRGAVLPFLQVINFTRMFAVDQKVLAKIRSIVLSLTKDDQLEVREAAAHTLVILIRDADVSQLKDILSEMLASVRNSNEIFLQQRRQRRGGVKPPPFDAATVLARHGAVLVLSSFVMSSPYSVPAWMPEVLLALTLCINDPPPISTSVQKLFAEFWRTHRDEWQTHKSAFTEDELEAVSELLISPSYYA